jgi:PHD/YefM family antitoxin component YafN of YafNO toxin-antitoxin module
MIMNEFVSVTDASLCDTRTELTELLQHADGDPVYLHQQNRPVGVLLSSSVFEDLLGRLEELEDLVCVSRHRHATGGQPTEERIPWEKVKVELDLA